MGLDTAYSMQVGLSDRENFTDWWKNIAVFTKADNFRKALH